MPPLVGGSSNGEWSTSEGARGYGPRAFSRRTIKAGASCEVADQGALAPPHSMDRHVREQPDPSRTGSGLRVHLPPATEKHHAAGTHRFKQTTSLQQRLSHEAQRVLRARARAIHCFTAVGKPLGVVNYRDRLTVSRSRRLSRSRRDLLGCTINPADRPALDAPVTPQKLETLDR
jgi:hypothetical protein